MNRRQFLSRSAWAGAALGSIAADPPARRLEPIVLSGPPFERGLAHGRQLKEPIHSVLKLWQADLQKRFNLEGSRFVKKFLERSQFPAAIMKWTPDLLEEVRGIAKGCDVEADTMLVYQLMDEYWFHGQDVTAEHCSGLGMARRGNWPSHVAQNMDLEGFRNGYQAILHIQDPRREQEALVLSCAGMIGLNGLNRRGVGICCNTLNQLDHCRDGLPVACVVRGVLAQRTVAEAVAFLKRVKHASGQNYLLGGPAEVFDFECSAGKVVRFQPAQPPGMVWHTNHPLASDDYHAAHRRLRESPTELAKALANSTARLQAVESRLRKEPDQPPLKLIQAVLASRDSAEFPVCRRFQSKQVNFTFASTIMVLAEQPELLVAAGPPDTHPYQRYLLAKTP